MQFIRFKSQNIPEIKVSDPNPNGIGGFKTPDKHYVIVY